MGRRALERLFLPLTPGTMAQSAERLIPWVSVYAKRIGKTNCRTAGLQKTVTSFNQTM
jgi:hypothetical protein